MVSLSFNSSKNLTFTKDAVGIKKTIMGEKQQKKRVSQSV
jgi:hypothetical protein